VSASIASSTAASSPRSRCSSRNCPSLPSDLVVGSSCASSSSSSYSSSLSSRRSSAFATSALRRGGSSTTMGSRRRSLTGAALCCLLLGSSLPYGTEAIHKEYDSKNFGALWTFLEYDVGLDPGAVVDIDLHSNELAPNVFVMILTHQQWVDWRRIEPTTLPKSGPDSIGGLNSYLVSYWRAPLFSDLKVHLTISAPGKDRYHVGILNSQERPLELSGHVQMVNPGGREMPLQEEFIPRVLTGTSLLFCGTCACYLGYMMVCMRKRDRTTMHYVMASAVCLKGIVLLSWLGDCLVVAKYGASSPWLQVGWQLLEKVQTILELMMFLLTALGWKFLRAELNRTEVKFACGISLISLYLGVFEVACTTQSTCGSYQLSRYILHSLCYLVVIVAMNFNMQVVYQQIADAPASMESGKLYQKYFAYKGFGYIFLAFIIAPTVELFLKVTAMPWDAHWLYVLIQQLRTWAIYMAIILRFTPLPHPQSLRVFELTQNVSNSDDDEDAQGDTDPLAE